jgi:glycosyltransferase involved in cell wall biosynthesis
MPPRVLIDATPVRRQRVTGVERYAIQVVDRLPRQRPDWDWHVVLRQEALPLLNVPPFATVHVVRSSNRLIRDQLTLPRVARRIAPQLVHFPAFPPPIVPSRAKTVLTVHDATFWMFPDAMSKGSRFYYKPLTDWHIRRGSVDMILTDSAASAADLRPVIGEAVPIRPIWLAGREPSVEQPHELSQDGPPAGFILAVGTVEPRKNLQLLVDAYAQLLEHSDQVPDLLIVGRHGWGDQLRVPDAISARVHLAGSVSDRELHSYYRHCAVFAMPSRHEGFGLPLVEAMEAGAACLVSDIPVFREVGGEAPLYAPADDVEGWAIGLAALLTDERLRAARASAAKERAKEFTWDSWAAATALAYEDALSYS